MAKKKKEEPVVDNETGKIKIKTKTENQPDGNETKGNVTKVKAKMKQSPEDLSAKTVTKVDLSKPPTAKQEEEKVEEKGEDKVVEQVVEEVVEEKQENKEDKKETPVLEEVTEEQETPVEKTVEEVKEAVAEAEATGEPLPENIQKLMSFMDETGGDLNDYVKLNQDYSNMENEDLLYEYYKQTKPHLNSEEINFLLEDQFSYDEEEDDDKEIRRKKLALKEQVASAKSHLDGQKSRYYEDIKAGSKLTQEQQKAIDFFNRYNKESEACKQASEKSRKIFMDKTNNVFNKEFKGFEYKIGDKKFRFNVKDTESVKQQQSDINNFAKKFLGNNDELDDAAGYHKSIFTAMNADTIARHFYEQGKADAIKDSIAKSKNVNMNPRQSHGVVEAGGLKVKVLGDNSSDFKFKIKNNK